jgi:eukaryotic-like serine/threonine-protein kinase
MLRTSPLPRDAQTVAVARPATTGIVSAPAGDERAGETTDTTQKTSKTAGSIDRIGGSRAGSSGDRSASRPRGSLLSSCNPFPHTLVSGSATKDDQRGMARESPMESTSPYRTGAIIASRYRLLRQLGRGGMGEVWAAHHLTLNTEVAVKFLSTGAGGNAAKIALERFRFEAQVSAHLGLKTAHVVAVHDAGRDDVGPYLVMEHVRGRTLRAELNRSGPLSIEDVATLLDQVCGALSVAHGSGIVHRDLKPSNLLLLDQPDGSLYVKVADFGIAKALKSDLAVDRPEDTSDGWMLGSPAYMSPEQMGGGGVDARSDMWALGVIIYECLTGRLPFPGRSVAELIINMSVGRFDPPSNVRPTLPIELDAWFLRALGKRKEQRFPRVEDMAESFRAAIVRRPVRRLPRLAQRGAGFMGLAMAMFALRPAPSEALPDRRTDASAGAATSKEAGGARRVDLDHAESTAAIPVAAPAADAAPTAAAASPHPSALTTAPALTATLGSLGASEARRGHGAGSTATTATTATAAPAEARPASATKTAPVDTAAPARKSLTEAF